jgi:hypothetical protein
MRLTVWFACASTLPRSSFNTMRIRAIGLNSFQYFGLPVFSSFFRTR